MSRDYLDLDDMQSLIKARTWADDLAGRCAARHGLQGKISDRLRIKLNNAAKRLIAAIDEVEADRSAKPLPARRLPRAGD